MNNKFYCIIVIFSIISLIACKEKSLQYYQFSGPTMGTTYDIKVQIDDPITLQKSIDSLLADFNLSMSLYIDSSTLVDFNRADSIFCYDTTKDPYFEPIFNKAQELYHLTGGALDPSIAPLVNYYGFGYKEKKKVEGINQDTIKKLLSYMQFQNLALQQGEGTKKCIVKPTKMVNLDFNSISPGHAVDVMAAFFDAKNIRNYMINLGGELRTLGVNDSGKEWVIGINRPKEGAAETEIELPLLISNKSLATSGNYRNNYESKGLKFAHIINPFTGVSGPTDILSTTIIADDCITADALATACMVLGLKKAYALIDSLPNVDACFIYDNEGDGIFEFKVTEGFSKYYLDNEQN